MIVDSKDRYIIAETAPSLNGKFSRPNIKVMIIYVFISDD